MSMKLDQLKWNLYLKKKKLLYFYGFANGLIHSYEKELIENLRKVYYGGVPASIMLLCHGICNGHCYDRALLITFGFGDDDFNLVDGDIDGITLNPKYGSRRKEKHFSNHCFVERTKKDGTTWVYDTSSGLVFEKKLYYAIQRPKITKINSKQATLNYIEYQEIKNANPERDKYVLPIIIPQIEAMANSGTEMYEKDLKEEIERFKQEINYEGIIEEIEQDMKKTRK